MRYVASVSTCVGVALGLALAGCSDVDKHYFKEGVGSNLYAEAPLPLPFPEDLAGRTALQNTYVTEICKQAGLVERACDIDDLSAKTWSLFVQAGMNDIDQRCDAYLTWLDNVRRAKAPTIKEIADAQTASTVIMQTTGVGAAPIAVVAAAFGFATNTFTNVTSRLVLEVDRSTVQAVVLGSQKKFREDLFGTGESKTKVEIASRPAAIYALRSYLRMCMPMTIETQINSTIATFERGGADALKNDKPMISAQSVGVPSAREILPPAPPLTDKMANPRSAQEQTIHRADAIRIQTALGVAQPNGDFGPENAETRQKIKELEQGYYRTHSLLSPKNPIPAASIDGIIGTDAELRAVMGLSSFVGRCGRADFANNYETGVFMRLGLPGVRNFVARALNKAKADNKIAQLPALQNVKSGECKVPADLRDAIKLLQQAYGQTPNGVIDDQFMLKAGEAQ